LSNYTFAEVNLIFCQVEETSPWFIHAHQSGLHLITQL